MSLEQAARDLALAVSGIDYDGAAVHKCRVAVHAGMLSATPAELAASLHILVDRIAASQVDDADGVAFAALTAGALVETGAPARPLAEVLLHKAPGYLVAARRFADLCLADLPTEGEEAAEGHVPPPEDEVLAEVDGRGVTHHVFRAHAPEDRGGASALALLQPWTLPAVAAISRDRKTLLRAARPGSAMREAALALGQSHAQWLSILLAAQLDATWLVLCPKERRGFRMRVDGVVSNYDLQALVADALLDGGGLAGPKRTSPELIAFIKGDANATREEAQEVDGQFQFYQWQAAAYDWSKDEGENPEDLHLWGEGIPSGVPKYKDTRTLIVGPLKKKTSWNNPRTFGGLPCDVSIDEELSEDEVVSLLAEMKTAAAPTEQI